MKGDLKMNNLEMHEIYEAETQIEYDEYENEHQKFKVADKASAEWCLRKIAAYKKEMQENQDIVNAEIQRLNEWLTQVNKHSQERIDYLTGLLQEYLTKVAEEDPKCKSIKLPHGTIRFKKQQPEWIYNDEKILKWLKQNKPELIQIIEKYNKNDIKRLVKETGEIIDGVEIQFKEDKFEVEVM